MLPGKKYTAEDILAILRRRIPVVLVPLAMVSAVTAVVVRQLPDHYRSTSRILVVPQRVPEQYVRTPDTGHVEDRVNTIRETVLSRPKLERVITEFDLYPEQRQSGIMQDVVERMRLEDVNVQMAGSEAFTVSFTGRDPQVVKKVADRLASLFMDESRKDRASQVDNTNQFLGATLENIRKQLIQQETRLVEYQRQHAGELPSERMSNLQAIQNRQVQIQSIDESINRDADRRLLIQRQIMDLESNTALPADLPGPAGSGTTLQQLAGARATLFELQNVKRYKDDHPDVQTALRQVHDLELRADAEALRAPLSSGALSASSMAAVTRQQKLTAARDDLAQLDKQVTAKQAEEKKLREEVTIYQARAEAAGTRETEMTELTRDYGTILANYNTLSAKLEESKIVSSLERQQIGEQFQVTEPARVPERPFTPDRLRLNLLGMAGGLALGLALVALLEYRNTAFATDDELASLLTLPVLAVVPLMESDIDHRRARRRSVLIGLGWGSTVVGCLAVIAYTLVQ